MRRGGKSLRRNGSKAGRFGSRGTGAKGGGSRCPNPRVSGADVATWMLRGVPRGGRYVSALWPVVLLAVVSGVTFDLVLWVISGVRRRIYNGNRNRKYAETKHGNVRVQKNMTWKKSPKKPWDKVPLPVPQGFAVEVCKQWDRAHDSPGEMIRFGRMMIALEDHVDNAFIFDYKGDIIGRHPGIKGFLAEHCPHIGYKTAMRYRILAMKAQEAGAVQGGDVCGLGRKTQEEGAGGWAQCETVRELEGKLDAVLKVRHRCLENPCPHQRRKRRRSRAQGAIYAMRGIAHTVIGELDASRRKRVADALMEIARELSAG